MRTVGPAWYRDPGGAHEMRYWDGENWTRNVCDSGSPATLEDVKANWAPPGTGQNLVTRAMTVIFLGVPLATGAFLLWALLVVPAEVGTAEGYGWVTFAQMLPVVLLMFAPCALAFDWCIRACRLGAGKDGRLGIWVSGVALAWALIVTDFAGLVPAVFGDTWDWTGFPLLVAKLATALVVTLLALRAASKGPREGVTEVSAQTGQRHLD